MCLFGLRLEVKGLDRIGCMCESDCVGKNDTEKQTRSSDMAGLVRNVSDSAERSGMDSFPWLSRPWTASSFTQYTIDKDKVRCI